MPARTPNFPAKSAADVRRDDADVVEAVPENVADRLPNAVGHLGRYVHREGEIVTGRSRRGQDDIALHRCDSDELVLEAAAHNDVGALERIESGRLTHASDPVRPDLFE